MIQNKKRRRRVYDKPRKWLLIDCSRNHRFIDSVIKIGGKIKNEGKRINILTMMEINARIPRVLQE